MNAPLHEDSIGYADAKLREALDMADYAAQQGIERRGGAPNMASGKFKLQLIRIRLQELVLLTSALNQP